MNLKKRIEELNAEKERIEKEIAECVKQSESLLGVPVVDEKLDDYYYLNAYGDVAPNYDVGTVTDNNLRESLNYFRSEESAKHHNDMMKMWRGAIASNSKSQAYPIDALLPLLRKGWVAMDGRGEWYWYKTEPHILEGLEMFVADDDESPLWVCRSFPIEKASDWKTSARECGV